MPLYNKVDFIEATIFSVINQVYSSWELLVVDNGSTDGGDRVIEKFRDPRLQLLHCSTRTNGPGAPRNFALNYARGQWILFLDADDSIEPDHLDSLLRTAQKHPMAAIVAGGWQEYIDGFPEQRKIMLPSGYPEARSEQLSSTIAFAPWAIHAAIVQRNILKMPYLWVEELDPYLSEDTAFWFRLLTRHTVKYSDSRGALYRRVANARDRHQDPEKWFKGIHAVLQNNVAFLKTQGLPITANHCEALMRRYSDIYLLARRQNNTNVAAQCLELAQYWLDCCVNLSGMTTFPLKTRHCLGLRSFLQLQYLYQKYF